MGEILLIVFVTLMYAALEADEQVESSIREADRLKREFCNTLEKYQ